MEPYSYTRSQQEFQRALKVIPTGIYGHLGPVEGCAIPPSAYPRFVSRAEGAYFWDIDGNRFIDYMCAYGPNILGYNDKDVDAAAAEQAELGNCTTMPFTKMIDLAELLTDTVAMADWAFFAKNGGDVTSLAVMAARAATGRTKTVMVKGNYHGVAPWTQKNGSPGVAPEEVSNNLFVEWGDFDGLAQLVSDHKGEIACFLSTPYWHPAFFDNKLPENDYWQKVRKLCTDNGIVLAIDDVRCGFRLDLAGSDHHYGFEADLLCFCKALGNGHNFSALCGTDAMKEAVASVFYTGSYWLSAVPFAAGIATIKKMREIDAANQCMRLGKALTDGLVDIARDEGFDLIVSGEPSMWYMRIANDDSLMLHQQWVAECVKRGVFFTNHHNQFINTALTQADIDYTHEIAREAFQIVARNNPEMLGVAAE